VLDQDGAWGELVRVGIERGRRTVPRSRSAFCGEHGGRPLVGGVLPSWFGMTYVSCSPYMVPVAWLAAAQAPGEEPRAPQVKRRDTGKLQARGSCSSASAGRGGSHLRSAGRRGPADLRRCTTSGLRHVMVRQEDRRGPCGGKGTRGRRARSGLPRHLRARARPTWSPRFQDAADGLDPIVAFNRAARATHLMATTRAFQGGRQRRITRSATKHNFLGRTARKSRPDHQGGLSTSPPPGARGRPRGPARTSLVTE